MAHHAHHRRWLQPTAGAVLLALFAGLSLAAAGAEAQQLTNVVTEWSLSLESVLRAYSYRHQLGLKLYAILHVAQVQALNTNNKRKPPLPSKLVVAVVSHAVLSQNLPDYQTNRYDLLLATHVTNYTAVDLRDARTLAVPIAANLTRFRVDDGFQRYAGFRQPNDTNTPGKYIFSPGQTFVLYPQLGTTAPFVAKAADINLTDIKPYATNSTRFLAELQEVYDIGGKAGVRSSTAEGRATADFWADGAGTSQHGGHWNLIALSLLPSNLTLYETARVLALANIAAFDAAIVTWSLKYRYLYWRPLTAIGKGVDGFTPDSTWLPYLAVPPHPEYPSGHSTTAGAFGWILTDLLKSDTINVSVTTQWVPPSGGTALPARTYTSINAIVKEDSLSRITGGVHFRKATADAELIGARIARVVKAKFK